MRVSASLRGLGLGFFVFLMLIIGFFGDILFGELQPRVAQISTDDVRPSGHKENRE